MKNIHVLPTDKPSRLFYYNSHLGLARHIVKKNDGVNTQHIYITNDEEIKEGEYQLYNPLGNFDNAKVSKAERLLQNDGRRKKIILTDNPDLIKDGVQAIDDEFLEWFVSKANDSGKPIDIVEVRKEKYSERFDNDKSPIGNPDTWGNRWVLVFPKEEITFEEVFGEEKKKGLKEFIDKQKQKQHLIDMMQDDEESGLYDYGWCKGNVVLPKEYPGEYDETQAKQVLQLANNLKQETLEEIPTELKPVLAKISHINDLGKSEWYEVVYYNNKWCSYSGSKTFQDGERVLEWKYCKDLI